MVGDKLQIDTSSINKHPGIQKVLNNRTRGGAYMRQYFKLPLEHVTFLCDCIACARGLFSPLGMPLDAYKEISILPLHIPQPPPSTGMPGDLHYMTLEEARMMPFTAEYQPSIVLRSRNNTLVDGVALGGRETVTPVDAPYVSKTFRVNHVRRVLECKERMKPRYLFSNDAPNRMKPTPLIIGSEPTNEDIKECWEYAMQQLEATMENDVYICGMQPLEPDNPMHRLIIARDGLECNDLFKFEYYTHPYLNAEWFKATMCAYCAGPS